MGETIPRLLPCSHTFCHKCLNELLQDNSLECPECRSKHCGERGLRSFPQNKYILSHRRTIGTIVQKESNPRERFQNCKYHGKELSLFCKSSDCQMAICQLCMIKHHKTHEVTDIDEDRNVKFEALVSCIGSLTKDLQTFKKSMVAAKQKLKSEHATCTSTLEKRKEEYLKRLAAKFDNLILRDSSQMANVGANIDNDIAIIDENLTLLRSFSGNNDTDSSHDDITTKLEIVQNIATQVKTNLSVKRCYQYHQYNQCTPNAEVDQLCGHLVKKNLLVDMFGSQMTETSRPIEAREKQDCYFPCKGEYTGDILIILYFNVLICFNTKTI